MDSSIVKEAVISNQWMQAVGGVVATFAGPAGSATWASYMSNISGGSLKEILIAGAIADISAGIAYGIGETLGHGSSFLQSAKDGGNWAYAAGKAVAHGVSRAVITKVQGGKFSAGFWSGFVASGFSVGTKGFGGFAPRTAIMAMMSGTTSVISGGKFANGAVSGAFVHMFNEEQGSWTDEAAIKAVNISSAMSTSFPNWTQPGNTGFSTTMNRIHNYGLSGSIQGAIVSTTALGPLASIPGAILGYAGGLVYGAGIVSGLYSPMPDIVDYLPKLSVPKINK